MVRLRLMRPPAARELGRKGVGKGRDIVAEEVDIDNEITGFGVLIEAAGQCVALVAAGRRDVTVSSRDSGRPSGCLVQKTTDRDCC